MARPRTETTARFLWPVTSVEACVRFCPGRHIQAKRALRYNPAILCGSKGNAKDYTYRILRQPTQVEQALCRELG